MKKRIEGMLQKGIIQESNSPLSHSLVIVCEPEVQYLGHIVSKDGICPNPDQSCWFETIQFRPVVETFVAL